MKILSTKALSVMLLVVVANGLFAKHSEKGLEVIIDIEVKGVVPNGLRAVVVNDKDEAYPMGNLERQLRVNMEYGTTFLIEFQHGGCVAKQLLFNTNLPKSRQEPRQFRTDLVLEVLPSGQDFEYLGPVGYIFFDSVSNEFLYHSDYSKSGEKQLLERMEHAKKQFPQKLVPVILTSNNSTERPYSPSGTLVRTRRPTAPMIHITGRRSTAVHVPEMFVFHNRVDSVNTEIVELSTALTLHDGRKKREVQYSNKLRIIQDVHIHEDGREKLYRKVVHRYGTTHYFCRGQSCTEEDYLKGIR